MAAWQHLVLQEGHGDELGTGRATALLDMTKCFEQVRLWHVWRWDCHWDFPRGLFRVILLVFSFQRKPSLQGDCLMSKWPRLRLTEYVDDLTISYSGRNHTVADTISEATGSLIGWLESGLDFHVAKDENWK